MPAGLDWRASALVALIASFALAVGCGGGDADPPDGSADPAQVAAEFIRDVAHGDPAACEVMTHNAIRQAKITGGVQTCEEAIEGRKRYLRFSFDGAGPEELTAELGAGALFDEAQGGAKVRFCLPSETRVTVTLTDGNPGWEIDGVGTGSSFVIGPGGKHIPDDCRAR